MAFTLFSCSKEEPTQTEKIDQKELNIDFRGGLEEDDCLTFVYPVTLIFPDDSEVEVSSRAKAIRAIRNYVRNNPGQPFKPTIKFPYEIILTKDDKHVLITNTQDEQDVLESCQTETDDPQIGDCYQLVFPLSLILPDGKKVEATSQEDYDQIIHDWTKANPNATEQPKFVLPYSVILKNGKEKRIETFQDQQELYARCKKKDRPKVQDETIYAWDN